MGAEAAKLCDEALVLLVQSGSDRSAEAYSVLLERLMPVVHARITLLGGQAADAFREDLAQEGVLGFLSAVAAFRRDGDAAFRTFASVCISNRIVSALRRIGTVQTLPYAESGAATGGMGADPQEIFFAMEETRAMAQVIRNRLTKLERGVLQAFLQGERYGTIARRMGVSGKAVDNAMQRVRKKLQQFRD